MCKCNEKNEDPHTSKYRLQSSQQFIIQTEATNRLKCKKCNINIEIVHKCAKPLIFKSR